MEILIILGIIIFIIVGGLKLILKNRFTILVVTVSAVGIVSFGVQYLISYVTEKILKFLKLRYIIIVLGNILTIMLTMSLIIFGFEDVYESYSLSSFKFIITAILIVMLTLKLKYFKSLKSELKELEPVLITKKEDFTYVLIITSILLNITSMYAFQIFYDNNLNNENLIYFELLYYIGTIVVLVFGLGLINEILRVKEYTVTKLYKTEAVRFNYIVNSVFKDIVFIMDNDDTIALIELIIAKQILDKKLFEIDIDENYILMRYDVYQNKFNELILKINNCNEILTENKLKKIINSIFLYFSNDEVENFIEHYLNEIGEYRYDRLADKNFILFAKKTYRICSCCGTVEYFDKNFEFLPTDSKEWYCSEICEETEKDCLKLRKAPYKKFLSEISTAGYVLMEAGTAWNNNHTMTSPIGNNTHGYAAEKANNLFDRINRKDAKIVGGDNAKNGADRLVNGELIQTKYYSSARGTVESTFDSGTYKYLDPNGKPMILEVPKDQYEQAVKIMSYKIKKGQVPNVTDPNEAKNLVKQGSVTYQQSKNITKFGTFESVAYDLAEGTVVSINAAGISFGITVAIHYLNSKDKKQAIDAAINQAGRTFLTTMIVYTGTQQLHRVASVNTVLSHINVNRLPKSLQNAITKGLGANSAAGANKMLRGNIVASAVLIAISTGPEFLKMVRGKISGAQFLHNTTVISSGIAGGGVGSILGGIMGAPLGPIGILGGKIIGGIAGGMIVSSGVDKVLSTFRKSDREQMLALIEKQLEVLSKTFMVAKEEMDNISDNLSKALSQKVLEDMYCTSPEERLAFANSIIKPLFVMAIRQRDILVLEPDAVIKQLTYNAA